MDRQGIPTRARVAHPPLIVAAGVVAVLAAIGSAAAVAIGRSDPPLARAVAAVADDKEFTTALRAGQQLARASSLVEEDARACQRDHADIARCARRFEAAGYLRTAAVEILDCARPAIYDTRRDALAYLRGLQHNAIDVGTPSLPRC